MLMEDLQHNKEYITDMEYILITGASSGIGRMISIHLSGAYNLILNGRNINKLMETKSLCAPGNDQIIYNCDLNNQDETENSFQHLIQEKNIAVSGFVHCAGYLKMLPFRTTSRQIMQDTMNINFFSAATLIKILISKKINGTSLNNIIFISSTASIMGAKAFSVYSASKGALDSFMRCLAVELAPNVRVNSVLPGAIRTMMTDKIFQEAEVTENMKADYPLGFGDPADIAEMVSFLLSPKAKWITGQQFVIDGGRTINISG